MLGDQDAGPIDPTDPEKLQGPSQRPWVNQPR